MDSEKRTLEPKKKMRTKNRVYPHLQTLTPLSPKFRTKIFVPYSEQQPVVATLSLKCHRDPVAIGECFEKQRFSISLRILIRMHKNDGYGNPENVERGFNVTSNFKDSLATKRKLSIVQFLIKQWSKFEKQQW